MGTAEKIERARQTLSKTAFNKLSVKLELQADFYAGVWANRAQRMKNILENGDLESALNAANAIGDDRLQKESSGRIMPDAFTHGSSAQRMYWFKKGFETGDISQGNTFDSNE
jgi:predicted metalloprotease